MKRKLFRVTAISVGLLALVVAGVHAAAFSAIVTPESSESLGFVEDTSGEASLTFVSDAGTSASGIGSLEFRVENAGRNSAAGAALRLESGWSLPLEHIVIRYSTYVQSAKHCGEGIKERDHDRDRDSNWDGDSDWDRDSDWDGDSNWDGDSDWDGDNGWKKAKNPNAAVALTMSVDTDNDGVADDLLIFDPAFNGDILCETWQQWPATAGIWYSTKGGTFATPGRPLAHYVVVNPGAKVVTDAATGSGISLAAGFGGKKWQGFIGNADSLSISDPRPNCFCTDSNTVCLAGPAGFYDFEPFE